MIIKEEMYLEKGLTLSEQLERLCPAPKGSGLDAYEWQLKEEGIDISSTVDGFFKSYTSAVLFPEYVRRTVLEGMKMDATLHNLVALTIPYHQHSKYSISTSLDSSRVLELHDSADIKTYVQRMSFVDDSLLHMPIPLLSLLLRKVGLNIIQQQVADAIRLIKSEACTAKGFPEPYEERVILANSERKDLVSNKTILHKDIPYYTQFYLDNRFALGKVVLSELDIDYKSLLYRDFTKPVVSSSVGFVKLFDYAMRKQG